MIQTDDSTADIRELGDLVERLAKVARAQGMASVKLEFDGIKLSIKAGNMAPATVASGSASAGMTTFPIDIAQPLVETSDATTVSLTAPMVGTFYASPSPGDPPFVSVGDRVVAGQTIGIIEAMKIMNEIPADRSGVVVEVLVGNGQAVEYGSSLYTIDPTA